MNLNMTQMNVGQTKLIFGAGAIERVPEELKKMNVDKPFILTDGMLKKIGIFERLQEILREAQVDYFVFDEVTPDPGAAIVDHAVRCFEERKCDSVIGFGGGSVMDAAKCTAAMVTNEGCLMDYDHANASYQEFVNPSVPLINIPTTSGTGSEMSPYAVITNEEKNRKATIGSAMLLSRVAVVDPMLVMGLPKRVTAATGADALTHCIEAYTTRKSLTAPNPIIDTLALTAIQYLYENLAKAYRDGSDYEAREKVMWGSVIGGIVLQYGSGASHGLGNVLGGEYHVPHGNAVGMLLPHVMEFNRDVCGERYLMIANKLGMSSENELVTAIRNLLKEMEMPRLSEYIKDEKEIDRIAELAVADKCTTINAKTVSVKEAGSIYVKAL